MRLTWYNRNRRLNNGIVWARIVGGPISGWGFWMQDRSIGARDEEPYSPLVLVRMPRYTLALLVPQRD